MQNFKPILIKYGVLAAFVVALVAMLGSLYYSEIAHFIPCTLCWYQRILIYPLVLILLVGLVEQDDFVYNYVLPFSLIGLALSTYHYLIQQGLFGNTTACTIGIPCSARYVNYLGFITIPFMALIAFILITFFMLLRRRASVQV